MRFLVTGGAGFIGSNTVEKLLQKGYSVRILDNFSTGSRKNIKEFEKEIELIEGDIRSFRSTEHAVKGVDIILHQAALPSVPRSIDDPITTNEVNIGGTLNILNAAKDAGVRRIVFSSSSSVYGTSPDLPKQEEMMTNPLSPYAVSKLACENYMRVFTLLFGLETICLRYFNVFGPKQDPTSQYAAVIPKFIRALQNNKRPIIFGDGTQSRDFTYVENVINGNLLAATMPIEFGSVVNCAAHNQITLNDVVKLINTNLGKNIKPIYENPRPGDIKHSFADINKISRMLNYQVKVNFEEGLKLTIESMN